MTEHPNSHGRQRTAAVRQPAPPGTVPGVPAPVPGPDAATARLPRQPGGGGGCAAPGAEAPRERSRAEAHPEPAGRPGGDAHGATPAREGPGRTGRTDGQAGATGAVGGAGEADGAPGAPGAPATPGTASAGRTDGSVPGGADGGGPAATSPTAAGATGGERLRFVGAATRRIARGIDLDEIVLGLCRATVPTFADAILVYLRDPLPVGDERPVGPVVLRLRRTDQLPEHVRGLGEPVGGAFAAPAEAAPDRSDPATDLAGAAAERCEVRIGGPLAEVLRGVRPVFGDSSAARAALPELLGEGRCVPDRHRTILAPLRGRRRVIGAAVFIRRADRPAFEGDDLLVAAQLATHTALGVDKAVLYGREVYIADELQRTMLPDSLPQPTGVRLASRYLPAAETARVGGDWYDAIPLPGNRVALVVGDVMGHSMTSAAIMGQLRTTAQTLAGLDLPPAEVLHHLDEQAQRLGSDRMATCLYAVYDPVAHRIVIANAGHPPPIMLHRGGRAEVLRVPPGAPIGVGGVDFEAVELDAPAGATLLLYTDGLVESRIRDVWTGIEQLRERLIETARLTGPNPPPLEPLCDEVLGMLGPGDRDDDIALLAARFEGIAPSDVAYWFLDPRPQTARQARRLARRALTRWGLEELTDSVELLVSEVITNAVRYAERPITLRLLRTDVLRCEVGDDVPQLPRLRQARPSDEGGRGLYLVNRLARRWGATRLSTGKVVWFELALPAHAR
ncbi:ATP-binding SpoIIE family protein phosphatase [Streptomyces albireticuli]|uniref:ATP-binding SpoIIE family protein phosphatase n=2 Tax=Streptomyces albireticuli TaxID=1940 RepID=UPI001E356BA4|nr:ATP-binding SpoIIE family protein phosphatase [Streptomyces albireticuli]MCD9142645.1 serine/threonine-protein phosphatase [Streptomyces albireticuli]MCD9164044.1 serine/threonine-protein phosphatase [Streptomyces albireticuli]MCD9192773.1 serine/threonine-protein phosphatase [Streptomyces albireticuli]